MDRSVIKDLTDPIREALEQLPGDDIDRNCGLEAVDRVEFFLALSKIDLSRIPAFPHLNHGPLVEEGDIRCDHLHCAAGMGVAGAGRCHRGGDPRVKDCPRFEDEEKALADLRENANESEVARVAEIEQPVEKQKEEVARGWGWPSNSKKAHYFVSIRSLCGRWAFFGRLEQGDDDSPDNCPACTKKLVAGEAERRIQEVERRIEEAGQC